MSRIISASVNVLGQTFSLTSNQLSDLSYQLGAQDRSSSCTIKIVDPDLKVSDVFYKWSKSKGGIKVPAALRGSGYQAPVAGKPNTNPTVPTVPGNANGGSTGTGSNAGKLEGLESLPVSFSAFLETIGWCENRGYNMGNLAYNVRFGGFKFSDYSRHPDIVYCSGGLCSNAAGAFQFIGGDPGQSWEDMRKRFPKELPGSFLPKYQNLAAMLAIKTYAYRSNDAYNRIIRGTDSDISAAARGVSWFWASLPGAPYGQPTVSDSQFLNKYKECLKRRQGSSYSLDFNYNTLHDLITDYKVDSSGWMACKRYANAKLQVTVVLRNGNEDQVYEAIKWLVAKNNLVGSWCMVNVSDGTTTPGWRSKDFPSMNDELFIYQAIFDAAGVWVRGDKLKPIPGFNSPGTYVKPKPENSRVHPKHVKPADGAGTTTVPSPGQGASNTNTSANADNPGEKLTITVNTAEGNFKHQYILTDTSVDNLPIPELTIQGQSIRYSLEQAVKTENYLDITPQELITVVGASYGYKVNDYTETIDSITRYEQRNITDLNLALETAKNNGIILTENSEGTELELYSNTTSTNLVISDIIDITFQDNGVVNETPQYPVSIKAITSNSLLKLKPETQISLDSVYNFIPASIKNGTWVINTITHDVLNSETTLDLLKTIEKTPVFASTSPGTVTTPTFTEAQLLDKFKSATVRLGSASGAFITSDGYILTAEHMRRDPNKNVQTLDGKKLTYTIIGSDAANDLMIVKVDIAGVNFFSIAPDSKIWESDKNLSSNPIYKLGHGWSSEDGRNEGGKQIKPWDITASFVRQLNQTIGSKEGKYIVVDDKQVDFANPGDSGCPWFDKWGLLVSCTSGGDRTHAEGAGRKDRAWGGETAAVISLLDKYKVPYTKGVRTTTRPPTITNPGGNSTNTVGTVIGQRVVAAMNQLGKFSTTESGLGRNPCMWSVNKCIRKAGYADVGSNPNYVPSARESLQAGRGRLISKDGSYKGAQPGDIWIYMGSFHVGIFLTSNIVRSSSSSRERFDNDDSDGTLFGIYKPSSWDGQYNNFGEVWRLLR